MAIALTKPATGIIQGLPWAIALSLLGDYTGATFAGAVQHGKRPTDKTPLSFGTPTYNSTTGRSLIPIFIADTSAVPLGRNWTWDAIAQLPGGDPSAIARGSIAVFDLASDPGDLGIGSGSPTPKLVIEINSGIPEINILSDADPEYISAITAAYVAENGTSSGVSSINGATGAIAIQAGTNVTITGTSTLTISATGGLTQDQADARYRLQSVALTDADIPSAIARDSEVSAAVAAVTPASIGALTQTQADARYRLQSVALVDGDIPAAITRDTELAAAIAAITPASIGALTQTVADTRYRLQSTAFTDADIPATIARDSEVSSAIAAINLSSLGGLDQTTADSRYRLQSVALTDADIPSAIARDTEVASAITAITPASIGALTQAIADGRYRLQSVALTDADIPAVIARDSEVTAAIASHVAAPDPHPNYALESSLATVATTGAYADLSGRPTLGTAAAESAASLRDRTTHTGTQAASTVTPVTTNLKIATGANLQVALEETDIALVNARSTGVRYGGFPSVVGGIGVGTTVNVTAGHGQILNTADAANPTYSKIFWTAKTGLAIANTSVSQTFWYVDDNSDVIKQQTTFPTRAEERTKLFLFRTSLTGGVITAVESEVNPSQQIGGTLRDLADALGPLRATRSDLIPSKGTGALKLAITAGGLFRIGANWSNSYLDPNVSTLVAFDSGGATPGQSTRFRYAVPSGPIAVDLSDIQVANYAPSGVVTAIPGASTRVGLHFIFRFPAGNCRIVYGSSFYTNLDEAVAALGRIDPFTLAPESFKVSGFCVGAIAATKSETDLVNARFVTTNQFGNFSGAVASQLGALLQSNNLSDLASISTAVASLGLTIGTNVQAYNAKLAAIAALTPTNGQAILGNGTTFVMGAVGAGSGFPKDYRVNPVSFTGSTAANQFVASMVFPGGTFADGDRLHAFVEWSTRGGSSGTCNMILELIHSGGTTQLFSNSATASQSRQIIRYVAFESANINFHPDVSNSQPFSALGGSVVRTAIDLAQQVTLRVGFTLSNAADTWWLNQFHAEHKRTVTL